MDDIEKRLYHDLNLKMEIPEKCEEVIKEAFRKKKKHYSWRKIAITACASLIITAGVVYAGVRVAKTIWEEPEKVIGYVSEENISQSEKSNLMSEKDARERAKDILNKFGYDEETIKTIKLEKSTINYKISWKVETNNNILLEFDAKGNKGLAFFNYGILNKDIEKYHTTRNKVEKVARNLCEKFGYDLSEYSFVEIDSNLTAENEAYLWYVKFNKEYDGLIDNYNGISLAFVPDINEIYYFVVSEENYENNPVEITVEQAKTIALKEEEKTGLKYNVKNTDAELNIVSMNGEAYARTNNYKQFCEQRDTINYPDEKNIEYRTNKRIRKAWKVSIEYDIPEKKMMDDSFNNHDLGYVYYVDATTGEIIGGEDYNKTIIESMN